MITMRPTLQLGLVAVGSQSDSDVGSKEESEQDFFKKESEETIVRSQKSLITEIEKSEQKIFEADH